MKLSKYNNQVPYGEKTLLYNAYTDKFILVEPLINDLFTAAKNEGPEALQEIHPTFFEVLKNRGFIVDHQTDELELVKLKRAQVDLEDDTEYKLIINPTMNCNFKCWYCYESHIKDSKMTAETIESLKKHISSVVGTMENLKTFHISWFGGEPFLFYEKIIKPVSEYAVAILSARNITLSTTYTTNGFLIKETMIEEFHKSRVRNFQITLDGNKEMHDTVRFVNSKKGSYDDIVANVLLLCRNELNVSLRINYTKSNLTNLDDIIEHLGPLEPEFRKYMTITFHKVWQETDKNLGEKVSELNQKFRTAGFRSIYGGVINNVRRSCYADRRYQATINYNGDVFKCTARNFSAESKEGSLNTNGVIEWNHKREERLDVKFKNKPCLECPILPICNGGCSQKALENAGKDYCVYNFDNNLKAAVILNKYDFLMNPPLV
ncbi:radical SAM/SPASM domain-containing protein [Pedobacter antarcticus]|uniref:radical SAM/SPASM domain-containing protein n=1 Tax=Pedobacter antarcticus TaxID=34086 RepID=UPI001C580463|nr:radical SAM protein [Pedobacter antarcticus]